jgi:hypothetical protein
MLVMFIAVIPSMTYVMPAISGVIISTVKWQLENPGEVGKRAQALRWGFLTYAAASLLSLMIVPEREAVTYFVLIFGYYPLIRDFINRAGLAPVRFLIKLIFFNSTAVLSFNIVVGVIGIPVEQMLDGLDGFGEYALYFLWGLGNVVFFTYDFALKYVYYAFLTWVRPALNKKIK